MKPSDDFSFYLRPVDEELAESCTKLRGDKPYRPISIHTHGVFPDTEETDVVIIGMDDRLNRDVPCGADEIRKQLYRLHLPEFDLKIADLGNIIRGENENDTHTALRNVISGLALHRTTAIILGGGREFTHAAYAAYEVLETSVNLAVIAATLNMGEFRKPLSADNYLSKIVIHKPSYLFNLSVLGCQKYFNDPETVLLMDKLYFDVQRLGEIRDHPTRTEPLLRQADILSIDLRGIKAADAPGSRQPNGLTGEEVCRMSRYAGLGDRCSCVGLFNYFPEKDLDGQTAMLCAQIVWHIFEGLGHRVKEYPLMNRPDFLEYRVQMASEGEHITFFKSKKTDKWWMNVPYTAGENGRKVKHHLIPCNYSDYEIAATGEVPDLWWRTFRKLT